MVFVSEERSSHERARRSEPQRRASGGSVNTATRQQAKALLSGPTRWSPDEESVLRQIVQGTTLGNALRLVGRLSPTGNSVSLLTGLGTGGAGFAAAGLPGLALGALPSAVGYLAKGASDRMTTGAMDSSATWRASAAMLRRFRLP